MSWRRPVPKVTLTHKPTGVSASVDLLCFGRNQSKAVAPATAACHRMLLSKLANSPAPHQPCRSYHLHTYLGVEPFVEQGGRKIAVGMPAIEAMLAGRISPPTPPAS